MTLFYQECTNVQRNVTVSAGCISTMHQKGCRSSGSLPSSSPPSSPRPSPSLIMFFFFLLLHLSLRLRRNHNPQIIHRSWGKKDIPTPYPNPISQPYPAETPPHFAAARPGPGHRHRRRRTWAAQAAGWWWVNDAALKICVYDIYIDRYLRVYMWYLSNLILANLILQVSYLIYVDFFWERWL